MLTISIILNRRSRPFFCFACRC